MLTSDGREVEAPCHEEPEPKTVFQRLASALGVLLAIAGVVWVGFALAYMVFEPERSLVDALHFSMQTLSTTGYGDVPPQSTPGKIVAMLLQPLGKVLDYVIAASVISLVLVIPHLFTDREQRYVLDTLTVLREEVAASRAEIAALRAQLVEKQQ